MTIIQNNPAEHLETSNTTSLKQALHAPTLAVTNQLSNFTLKATPSDEQLELVEALVKYGNNPDGIPPLLYAIKCNDIKTVKLFLNHGADVHTSSGILTINNFASVAGNTLNYSSAYGSPELLILLEKFGLNLQELRYIAPASNNNTDIINFMISRGIPYIDDAEIDPFRAAAFHDYFEVFKLLYNKFGVSTDKKELLLSNIIYFASDRVISFLLNKHKYSPSFLGKLLFHSIGCKKLTCSKILLEHGASITEEPHIFERAARTGDKKFMELLTYHGADLNPKHTQNLLQTSWIYEFPTIVEYLIQLGVSVHKTYDGGKTPLHFACQCNQSSLKSIKLLLEAGADINAKDSNGNTPLHHASQCNETILFLIQHGANIHIENNQGVKTYCSCFGFSLEVLKSYLSMGAKFNEPQDNRRTSPPIFHRLLDRKDSVEVLRFLSEKTTLNLDAQNQNGETAFFRAVVHSHLDLMEFLFTRGANINIKDKNGNSALAYAKIHRQELVPWLEAHGAR